MQAWRQARKTAAIAILEVGRDATDRFQSVKDQATTLAA